MAGVARTDLGKRRIGNMKRLHLPGAARTNFPKYPGFFGKAVRENARKCDEQISRFRFIENRAKLINPAPAIHFSNAGTNILCYLICVKNVYSSRAKSMLPFS